MYNIPSEEVEEDYKLTYNYAT